MSHGKDADEIAARLVALPRPTLGAAAHAQIHARSRDAFLASAAAGRARAAPSSWVRCWTRALEPIAIAAIVVGYLVWTASALAAIDWGRLALPSMHRVGSMAGPRAADGEQND